MLRALSVLFVCFVVTGCETPSAPVAQAQTVATRWHMLGTWSGRGNRQTESFDVSTGAMRLTWETRATDGAGGDGTFRVLLHSSISGRPLQTIVERSGPGSGTTYVEDDPRVSYLVIESEQVAWRVTLDEAVPATPSPRD